MLSLLIVVFEIVELSIVELSIVEFVIDELSILQELNVELSIVELSTVHETILEHCLTVESSMEELAVTDELSETLEEALIVELSAVYKSLEGQLEEADELPLSEESESLDINSSKDSPLAPPPPPPPLQEITRKLK